MKRDTSDFDGHFRLSARKINSRKITLSHCFFLRCQVGKLKLKSWTLIHLMRHENSTELLQFSVFISHQAIFKQLTKKLNCVSSYPTTRILSPLPFSSTVCSLTFSLAISLTVCFFQVVFNVQQPFNDIRRTFDLYKECIMPSTENKKGDTKYCEKKSHWTYSWCWGGARQYHAISLIFFTNYGWNS